jgi:hypothetical protein
MITIPLLGQLKYDPVCPELLVSEAVAIPYFDNQQVPFLIDPDTNPDHADVRAAISCFLNITFHDRIANTERVFGNYQRLKSFYPDIECEIEKSDSVWNHVRPNEIFVVSDSDVLVMVYCTCDWEIEHGLQLVFRNGSTLSRVSGIDGNPHGSDS